MNTALALLLERLAPLAHLAVGTTTLALAPFALTATAGAGEAKRAVLGFRRMKAATPAAPRSVMKEARSVAVLATCVAGLHVLGELRGGCFSIACIAGSGIGAAGVLTAVAAVLARVRRLAWSGGRVAMTAALAGMVGGVATTFAIAFAQRATGLDFLYDPAKGPPATMGLVIQGAVMGMLVSGLWGLAVEYPAALDEARRRTTEADRALREAELARLRGCLEPHFLLNALHAVAGLVDDEPRVARRLLAALGDLYRDALSRAEEVQPLAAEVAWLRRYAEILEARHAGALAFKWEIDRDAESLPVPTLLLQPLVENAVKHGALACEGAGQVVVRARVERNENGDGCARALTCVVEDDGPGLSATPREGAHGLSIVRQRLAVRYGDRASFTLENSGGRTRAVVRLPAMEAV
jgi:signal transduction histidine kinase